MDGPREPLAGGLRAGAGSRNRPVRSVRAGRGSGGPVGLLRRRGVAAGGGGRAGAGSRSSQMRPRPRRRPLPVGGRGESGGAVSLWVVLMVPVSAFAAVVAMAGPQRLAAESSMREAADDVATMAVAWRYTHQQKTGPIPAFPPECTHDDSKQQEQLADLEAERLRLEEERNKAAPENRQGLTAELLEAEAERDAYSKKLEDWRDACVALFESVVRDLGNLGVSVASLRGFYSDSLDEQSEVPCRISERVVVQDAVHVALAADWQDAGWAAAQVWPDGRRLGAESIGRRSRAVDTPDPVAESCGSLLDVLDDQGRPVVLTDPVAGSRVLSDKSAKRTALSG